jgi:hypothetical protein
LIAFRKAYQEKLGKFQKTDANLLRYIGTAYDAYFSDPKALEKLVEAKGGVPLPIGAVFEKGGAQIWIIVPQQVKSRGKPSVFIDIAVVPPGGKPIFLIGDDVPATPGTVPGSGAIPDPSVVPPTQPAGQEAPKADPPAPPTGG